LTLLFNLALEYAIRKFQANLIKENAGSFLETSKEVSLELNN